MKSTINHVQNYLNGVRETVASLAAEPIDEVVEILLDCAQNNHKVFIFGNGGSASTASHFACDLSKNTIVPGAPRFKVIALTDNMPLITAWANDTAYDNVFAEQLLPLVEADDVVIGISCSGNSPNVLNAMKVARAAGAQTIAFTGDIGGRLQDVVDLCIKAPSPKIEVQEDIHLMLEHCICSTVREELLTRNFAFIPADEEMVPVRRDR
ncbi:MAG: Phosphoheptose isomerase [Anaerolineae bacterium]|nr:Phosphoheptose isomerase [Anaerolineae bacterium]